MPKLSPASKVAVLRYPDVWPLISYSAELHDLLADLADSGNWEGNSFKLGDIRQMAEVALQRAPDRPHGSSTPIRWQRRVCVNGHVWDELVAWSADRGWLSAGGGKRNHANRPICPECGQMDSPKARRKLGIKS